MDNTYKAIHEILGEEPIQVHHLDSGNNNVLRVKTKSGSYVLKYYQRDRNRAYEREVGMRECLREFSTIRYPDIIGSALLGENRCVLMEDIAGKSLIESWIQDCARASKEMNLLGRMLGSIHEIPVAEAMHFLKREEVLFTENYFGRMMEAITPFLKTPEQISLLHKCHEIVVSTLVEEVVIHADFGPHQVIVDSQGQWILIDFEYAAIGAFVDDLAGTEVRLEQNGFSNIEGFLGGYESVRGRLREYEPVRSAYKAYNLLAMLTYDLSQKGEEPPIEECARLKRLLANIAKN